MFLQKVYRYHKGMFAAMLLFVICQLFCFYKKGMLFSPWYNYGMYSEVITPQDNYVVTKVYAADQLLQGNHFSPQSWDRIHYNLQLAAAAHCNDPFYEKEVKRIFLKFHLPVPAKAHFINRKYAGNNMYSLEKSYLAQYLNQADIRVYPQLYSWNGNKLLFKDSLSLLPPSHFLCQ